MLVIWNERASPSAERAGTDRSVTSAPAKRIRPASGRSSPASWATSVVLPAPLGPITAWISPGRTARATPSVATTPPNRLVSPCVSRSGSAIPQDGGEEAEEPAPGKEHDADQDRSQEDRPVLRVSGQHLLE